MELQVRNVNQAYKRMMRELHSSGLMEDTRNGPAFVYPEPVLTVYENPTERILWDANRNANPIFHLMEALWMLAGRNDCKFLNLFNSRMASYSDDGKTLYGAYGYRWHYFFGSNQLDTVIRSLRDNPSSRRVVLTMWSPKDLGWDSKDIPCNTHIYFRVTRTGLDMTVCNRSNDMIWGAYGTNYVHFSILQEYVAACAGYSVGKFYHFSNNFHAYAGIYTGLYESLEDYADLYEDPPYFTPQPLVNDPASFLDELRDVLCWTEGDSLQGSFLKNYFLYNPICMARAWRLRRRLTRSQLKEVLKPMSSLDWRHATYQYINRNCNLMPEEP